MFRIDSFPKAILHIDGDAFFASCEVAKNPSLKGKPVVTGQERGIASSLTYEAKARGVKRGMQMHVIRKICPDVVILPSDYETYSIYSERMYEIVRRYTPDVEEYSIDECFADLTGLRRVLKMSYEDMAQKIKRDLETELGMTFSIGLSLNKVIAKIGSKWKKPDGLTIIPGNRIHEFISHLLVEKVWGIGPNTSAYMNKLGINTAFDFASKDKDWVKERFTKPFQEIHAELRGESVYVLELGKKNDYSSISKTKTFTPPSSDREFVFSQLSKNIENACIKLRRHELFTKQIFFFLKTQDFKYHGLEIKMTDYICVPQEILKIVRQNYNRIFKSNVLYRATGIVLMNLDRRKCSNLDLFGNFSQIEKIEKIYQEVDKVDNKFGKHTLFLGSSFRAILENQHKGNREVSIQKNKLIKEGTKRKKLGIPFLGNVFMI